MHAEQRDWAISEDVTDFVAAARQAFAEDLAAAVLFGSAAEGRLRRTSDVNLILVLKRFDRPRADLLREEFRAAHAAIRLEVMYILENELDRAMEAFAVKFCDILSRRRILYGADPFSGRTIEPEAIRRGGEQMLLNLSLRLRERYALVSLREEQLALVIADIAGPLRACALALLTLEGERPATPREALVTLLGRHDPAGAGEIVRLFDTVRRGELLQPGQGGDLVFRLIGLADAMHVRLAATANRQGAGHG